MSAAYEAANRAYLENRQKAAQQREERRRRYESRVAEKRRSSATSQEIAALSRARTPKRLSAEQFDAQRASFHWPVVLQASDFDELRSRIEGLFAQRTLHPDDTGRGSDNCRQIQEATSEFHGQLRAKIHDVPANEYIAGTKYLKGLAREAKFEAIANPLAMIDVAASPPRQGP